MTDRDPQLADFLPLPGALYLTGQTLHLRAPVRSDAGEIDRWYEGEASLTPDQAEAMLVAQESIPWGNNPMIRLVAASIESSRVIGGVVIRRHNERTARVLVMRDRSRADVANILTEMLQIVLPWASREVGLMTIYLDIAADDLPLCDAALAAGMREAVRLRDRYSRHGGRVDHLTFEFVE